MLRCDSKILIALKQKIRPRFNRGFFHRLYFTYFLIISLSVGDGTHATENPFFVVGVLRNPNNGGKPDRSSRFAGLARTSVVTTNLPTGRQATNHKQPNIKS